MLRQPRIILQISKRFNNSELLNFSSTNYPKRVITVKTFGKISERLKPRLLGKHKHENVARLDHLRRNLKLDQYHIEIYNESELSKCLYPTKYARVDLPNDISYSNYQLESLGKKLLYLQVYEAYLCFFKRSESDICGYDFNYYSKLHNMSNSKRSSATVIYRHLKKLKLCKLARLPIPDNRVPSRVQSSYDQRCFNAIIGYISMANKDNIVRTFLRKEIAEKLVQTVLLR